MKKGLIFGIGILGMFIIAFWINRIPLYIKKIDIDSFRKYKVTIYRDIWGVPHSFGETDPDAAYGLAFAHAEDDFLTIQNVLLAAKGELARVYGKEGAPNDYMVKLLKVWEVVEEKYERDLSIEMRALCEAYADGLNHYASLKPEDVIPGLFPITGKTIVAGFVHRTPLMFDLDKVMKNLFSETKPSFAEMKSEKISRGKYSMVASNVIVIGPDRSEDGFTRIAINSHQPWEGPVTWYEAHVHSKEGWNMSGGLFPGSPVILKGHNPNLGWSHTVNQPDLIDVYELTLNPLNNNQYLLDGEWKNLDITSEVIKVKIWGPFYWSAKKEILGSVHGPVIRQPHGTYAIRYAGLGEIRQVEQWYKMNKSSHLGEFKQAMRMQAIPMFNTAYADKWGNIHYVYNALLPMRKEGYDWTGIIDGKESSLIWENYYRYDQLPQITNPSSGFIQNCNSTPFLATIGIENPPAVNYPLHTGIERFQTNRALRARETFGMDDSISREEFYQYKFDVFYSKNSIMKHTLDRFLSEAENERGEIEPALQLLKNWNLSTDKENTAAALAILSIRPSHNPSLYVYDYSQIREQLIETVHYLKENFGMIDVPWGQVLRLRRGKVDLPLDGGPDVLRAIYSERQDDRELAYSGDCFMQIVEWDEQGNVFAESIHQFGSATVNASSPHFSDQSVLFANHHLKPVWMDLNDIKENLEREYKPGE